MLAEQGRKHNKVTNQLVNVIEKSAEHLNYSGTSQVKIVQQNLAIVYPSQNVSIGPVGFGGNRNQDKFTQSDIFTIYTKGYKDHSADILLYLPKEQSGFPSGYNKRTYFINYRTDILFQTDNQTLGNLSSDVIAASVRDAKIQNLTKPVVIKFKPKFSVSDNETITCVSWNQHLGGNRGGWSKEGCSYKGKDDDYIICHCRLDPSYQIKINVYMVPSGPAKVDCNKMGSCPSNSVSDLGNSCQNTHYVVTHDVIIHIDC